MRIAGIDEAGRGSVIGPLVVAGVLFDEEGLKRLRAICEGLGDKGIRDVNGIGGNLDSKRFSKRKRESILFDILNAAILTSVVLIQPFEIDAYSLFFLEAEAMKRILSELEPDLCFVDVPTHPKLIHVFCDGIRTKKDMRIIGENKADMKFSVVGAASILAKVRRDWEIEKLKEIYGDFGSGYPGDKKTISFLKDWISRNKGYPDCVRKRWGTIRRIKDLPL
jgi:ribonuclease HII